MPRCSVPIISQGFQIGIRKVKLKFQQDVSEEFIPFASTYIPNRWLREKKVFYKQAWCCIHQNVKVIWQKLNKDDVPDFATPFTMITSSNGNISRVTGPLSGESTGHRGISHTNLTTGSFDIFFDLHKNIWLSKRSRQRWFEAPSPSLWRHSNDVVHWSLQSHKYDGERCHHLFRW